MDRFSKKIFPNTVKSARLELGLTQIAFGQRIGIIGENISGWETGCSFPTNKTIDALYSVYGINKEYLLHGQGDIFDNERVINNYILRVTDITDENSNRISGYDLALCRLNDSIWPIYSKSNAKINIKPDDTVIIYADGSKYSKCLIATAKISHIRDHEYTHHKLRLKLNNKVPILILSLKYISLLNNPVKISELVNKQDQFLTDNISKHIIRRECTKISNDDANIIFETAYK